MKHLILPSFRSESARFALRFTCEHCVYFDPVLETCLHGYPNEEHRAEYYARGASVLAFCKEFELE